MQNNAMFYKLIENKGMGDMGINVEFHNSKICPMSTSMHWHNYNEFELVISGKGSQVVNGYNSELFRGKAYFLSYADFHEVVCDVNAEDDEVFSIINVNFDDSIIEPLIFSKLKNISQDPVCTFSEEECCELENELQRMYKELESPAEYSKEILRFSINRVLAMYLRRYNADKKTNGKKVYSSKVQKAVSFIHNNFNQNISLDDVAEYAGCSPNYISGLLKAELGVSFGKYLKEIRLKYARSLINDGNTTVSGVARLSGFESVSYFIENYKKYYGETPGNRKE